MIDRHLSSSVWRNIHVSYPTVLDINSHEFYESCISYLSLRKISNRDLDIMADLLVLLLWFCGSVIIGPWPLRENNGQELASQSRRYIGYKHESYN